jgi:hypothetical protein
MQTNNTASLLSALVIAEGVAAEYGSINMFRNSYTMSREYNGIQDSILAALEQQDLLQVFSERCQDT